MNDYQIGDWVWCKNGGSKRMVKIVHVADSVKDVVFVKMFGGRELEPVRVKDILKKVTKEEVEDMLT